MDLNSLFLLERLKMYEARIEVSLKNQNTFKMNQLMNNLNVYSRIQNTNFKNWISMQTLYIFSLQKKTKLLKPTNSALCEYFSCEDLFFLFN